MGMTRRPHPRDVSRPARKALFEGEPSGARDRKRLRQERGGGTEGVKRAAPEPERGARRGEDGIVAEPERRQRKKRRGQEGGLGGKSVEDEGGQDTDEVENHNSVEDEGGQDADEPPSGASMPADCQTSGGGPVARWEGDEDECPLEESRRAAEELLEGIRGRGDQDTASAIEAVGAMIAGRMGGGEIILCEAEPTERSLRLGFVHAGDDLSRHLYALHAHSMELCKLEPTAEVVERDCLTITKALDSGYGDIHIAEAMERAGVPGLEKIHFVGDGRTKRGAGWVLWGEGGQCEPARRRAVGWFESMATLNRSSSLSNAASSFLLPLSRGQAISRSASRKLVFVLLGCFSRYAKILFLHILLWEGILEAALARVEAFQGPRLEPAPPS